MGGGESRRAEWFYFISTYNGVCVLSRFVGREMREKGRKGKGGNGINLTSWSSCVNCG